MTDSAPSSRRITLCADDYGISPGVNRAIRELIALRRINATSVMVPGPAFTRPEIDGLIAATADRAQCAIGLHVTLTAPFQPLTLYFRPLDGNAFLPLPRLLRASMLRRLDVEMLHAEIAAQLQAFIAAFGRPPDYVDGHQHVQLFPQVRNAFLNAVRESAPDAWVRQCGRATNAPPAPRDFKTILLNLLSRGFRRRADRAGLKFNPAFTGAYDFSRHPDFGALAAGFLRDLPDGGVMMCHPGFVDATLIDLDPLTHQREREYAWLASDAFGQLLATQNITLG
jgi:predicted glycoside hydrolase/deacetylase ChbG (UPF0249 family)